MHFPAAVASVESDSGSILIYFRPYTFVAGNYRDVCGIHDFSLCGKASVKIQEANRVTVAPFNRFSGVCVCTCVYARAFVCGATLKLRDLFSEKTVTSNRFFHSRLRVLRPFARGQCSTQTQKV